MFLKMLIYILSLDIATTNGEVVELVYGTSLENWRRFVAYRGFESHPLRQKIFGSWLFFLTSVFKI